MSRLAILLALCATLIAPAAAHEYNIGSLHIGHPWSRATPKGATIGAGYLKITNNGTTPDRLIGGSSDAAKSFELHVMSMENGVMKMRPVEGGIEIKPGETVEFKPESYHVMFVGLKEPLVQGHRVKATLDFAKAGKVAVEFVVESVGARQGNDDHAMPGMPHH
jgi:periplasmic copper chaperone A